MLRFQNLNNRQILTKSKDGKWWQANCFWQSFKHNEWKTRVHSYYLASTKVLIVLQTVLILNIAALLRDDKVALGVLPKCLELKRAQM